MKRIVSILFAILMMVSTPAFSQNVEMADAMRSNGKIYVIVAIVLIVLVGLIAYLFILDRKIGRLEKQVGEEK